MVAISDEVLFADEEVMVIIHPPKLQKSDLAVSRKVLLQWVLVCITSVYMITIVANIMYSLSSMHSTH